MWTELRIKASLFVFALFSRALSQGLPVLLKGPNDDSASIRQQSCLQCLFGNILEEDTFDVQWKINDEFIGWYGKETLTEDATKNFCPQNETIIIANLSIIFFKIIYSDTQLTELNVTCSGHSLLLNSILSSDPALLRIQGTLDQPPDLTVQLFSDQSKMIIRWNHPYTLKDVYISLYFVNITYFSSSEERNTSIEAIGGNVTSYEYSVPKGCTNYNISIQAETLAGLGNASFTSESVTARAPKKLTAEEVTVNVAYIEGNISLLITFVDSDCELEQSDKVDIEIYNGSNVIYVGKEVNLEHGGNKSSNISLTLPSPLQHLHANMTITLTNTAENKSATSAPIPLNLFNVQGLRLHPIQSGVEVMCEFVTGSDDLKCRVKIQCCNETASDDSSVYLDFNSVTRTANFTPCDHNLMCQYYCFVAFDASFSTPAVMEGEFMIPDGQECPSGVTSEISTATSAPNATTTVRISEDTTSITGLIIIIVLSVLLFVALIFLLVYLLFFAKSENHFTDFCCKQKQENSGGSPGGKTPKPENLIELQELPPPKKIEI